MIERAIKALVNTGLVVETAPAGELRVSADEITLSLVVEQRKRAPYPGELNRLIARANGHHAMLVAPYIPRTLGEALIAAGWSWADEQGNFDIRGSGLRWRQRLTNIPPARPRHCLPRGRAGVAIVRWLLTRAELEAPLRQSELARVAGVSQPRVSQILARLVELDHVLRRGRDLFAGAVEPLLDRFLEDRALLRGETFYGRTTKPLHHVAHGLDAAVSADVGLAQMASYPEPTRLVLYASTPPQWSAADAEESSPAAANLIWRVPEDASLLEGARSDGCVDPVQMMADLIELGGDHRLEAARMLRSWFLKTRAPVVSR